MLINANKHISSSFYKPYGFKNAPIIITLNNNFPQAAGDRRAAAGMNPGARPTACLQHQILPQLCVV